MKFVDVILPLALPRLLTYSVPLEWESIPLVGMRVAVQVGKKKMYAAVVRTEHYNIPPYPTKPIQSLLDDKPIVNKYQLELWDWVANYYMCSVGEVMKAALPAALKMESETKVRYNSDWNEDAELTPTEEILLQQLKNEKTLSIEKLQQSVQVKNVMPHIKQLLQKQAVLVEEHLNNPFKPKYQTLIRLHPNIDSEDKLNEVLGKLKRAPQQEKLLLAYLSESMPLDYEHPQMISKQQLLDKTGITSGILKGCVDKEVFELHQQEVSRIIGIENTTNVMPNLSPSQQSAYDKVEECFEQGKVTLLHGVTSSGKTEVYLHLMKKTIEQGKQVLYLLPEIALTAQLINRLTKIFGTKVGVYHSKFSDTQRVEIYQSLLNSSEVSIILGVRSSIFLPFTDLGLIIVDEEHENTYKQQDPAPRYHARDTAIVMAAKYEANILLGSATPSIESYHNAMEGKYGLVTMSERYGNAVLPEIKLVNVKEQRRKPNAGYFSPLLIKGMKEALEQREQIILFQNRRGFSPYIECKECGWIPQCEHCNVSLTYHKKGNQLVCHYCGYTISMPHSCLACGSGELVTRGMGTQKVEEELEILFPDIAIERMDLDTTRTRSAYERIISDFENRNIQILIGTQMVTKGLDFDNVSLVSVLNADAMLAYPDFRSAERSFQLILQVAGRAGRRDKQGMVLVQTVAPLHPILQEVIRNDYVGMYQRQVEERELFRYPPFVRLIKITLRHKDEGTLYRASALLDQRLKSIFGENVKGPEVPIINRIQNRYLVSFLLKIERNISADRSKQLLTQCFNEVLQVPEFRQLNIIPDVDPV